VQQWQRIKILVSEDHVVIFSGYSPMPVFRHPLLVFRYPLPQQNLQIWRTKAFLDARRGGLTKMNAGL
jgi:hypothetical protein